MNTSWVCSISITHDDHKGVGLLKVKVWQVQMTSSSLTISHDLINSIKCRMTEKRDKPAAEH